MPLTNKFNQIRVATSSFFHREKPAIDKAVELLKCGVGEAVDEVIEATNEACSQTKKAAEITTTKVKDKTIEAVDDVSNKLDDISGKKILEEVKALIAQQALYNNVLATKLQEALVRIEALEKEKTYNEY